MATTRNQMPWIEILNNQMVSYTDAPGGGFTLKSGKTHTTSDRCKTKAQALETYNLDPAYMVDFADNQLVPKIYWVPLNIYACELIGTGFIKIETSLPDITLVTTTDPNNQAGTNGTAVVTFVGGVGPFTYTLNSVAQGAATSPFTITGLSALTTYTVQVKDVNNNTDSATFTLGAIAPLTNVYGMTTTTSPINVFYPLGGYYDIYLCPVTSAVTSDFPGYENITSRLTSGYANQYLKDIKLFTPLEQTTNLTVEVFSEQIGITSPTPNSSMMARLVYKIVSTNATDSVILNTPEIQFPNSPTISSPGTSSATRYNVTYSVTIPTINVGQTLYVFWHIDGSNYFYQNALFQYRGFKITLKKYSLT